MARLTSTLSFCALALSISFASNATSINSLEQAITLAIKNDPWLSGNKFKQQSVESRGVSAGAYDDPQISIGLLNLPTDNWDLEQEGMTQVKVGVSQKLPRGDSLNLKQQQFAIEAKKFPMLRDNRKAQITSIISQLWLDAYLAKETVALIKNDKALFEQMVEIAQINYATTVDKTRQQDVIRAQLELVLLDERLEDEHHKAETAMANLSEWLISVDGDISSDLYGSINSTPTIFNRQSIEVNKSKPTIVAKGGDLMIKPSQTAFDINQMAIALSEHPAILAIETRYQASRKGVDLAKQSYLPQWGVNASYAYRDNDPNNTSRSDFFSVGVTFDLPLFTESKQDHDVAASVADAEVIKTEKLILLRKMLANLANEHKHLARLKTRENVYQKQLLNQFAEQSRAALSAYTTDNGNFTEVVRTKIAELNTQISSRKIEIEQLKTMARMNYYFAHFNQTKKAFTQP